MVLAEKEKAFPRGGRNPAISVPKKGTFSLFGKQAEKSHPNQVARKSKKPADTELKLHHVTLPTYQTLTEGMTILGCIRAIEEFKLSVSLPGKLVGEVSITNISAPLTRCLENLVQENSSTEEQAVQLNEIFRVGQTVTTCVVENGDKVKLSLMPEVIQSGWSPRSLTVGTVVVAAVSSHEETGYIMDTGIKNVRAFLKSSAAEEYSNMWNEGKPLSVGQIVKCVVTKSNVSSSVATVQLSADPNKVCKPVSYSEDFTMDTLLPGTLLKVSVLRVLKNGLEVDGSGYFTGYIHQDHLCRVWDDVDNYSLGGTHSAMVLYIMPTVKFPLLTLKKDFCSPEPVTLPFHKVKIGDILKRAEVIRIDSHGAEVKLRKTYKGFVPPHHLHESRPNQDVAIEDLHVGSKHKCRVLAYDYMAQLFICTLNKNLVEAEYVQAGDLRPGMKVICEIREHVPKGVVVEIKAGSRFIKAFVRSEHLSNVPLTNPEKKFPVGSSHPAKVLNVREHKKVLLTLKPKLVESDAVPLCHFEDFRTGMQCEGVVMFINDSGLLVTFYGDMQGWLDLSKSRRQETFYIGQVLKCYVQNVDVENQKIFLSLQQTAVAIKNELKVGFPYKLTVIDCKDDGLDIEVKDEHVHGTVPAQHLTDNPTLAQLLLRTFSPGDEIDCAYCFSKYPNVVFTLRPSLIEFFKTEGACEWSDVNVGQLLPCAVKKVSNKGVLLELPLVGSSVTFVESKGICDVPIEDASSLGLETHQGLVACVTRVGLLHKEKCVTTRLSKCWDCTVEPAVSLLLSFWRDYDNITSYLRKEGNPLANLRPGDRVKGKVTEVYDNGIVVKLKKSGVRGIVTSQMCRTKVKCGDKVEGKVIYVDYQNDCCELTVSASVMERINDVQDGKLGADGLGVGVGVRGEVLTLRPEMVVIVLKGIGRQQLAYIPVKCHVNDLMSKVQKYKVGDISKMVVQAIEGGRIICIQQRFEFELIKMRARTEVNKSKRRGKAEDVETVKAELSESEGNTSPSLKASKRHMSDEENEECKKIKLSDNGETDVPKPAVQNASVTRLTVSAGFVWDANPDLLVESSTQLKSDSSSDEEDAMEKKDGKKKKKMSKAELREKAIQEEKRLRMCEEMQLNSDKGPQSADDFDRLVLSSPDSSLCWIKYMAFHLQATEIEKARAVAHRAISTISFREEQEKLNVWCALLNLENLYGTKESLKKVLEEALKMNEPFKVYVQTLHMYADTNKVEETEDLVSTLTKKFRDNKEAWLQSGEALLKIGKLEKSRSLMQKALNSLEKKCHVEVISKFAHLENKLGEPERAQTLMEYILTSYPKRTDIWVSYVDMLTKKGLYDAARQVLERAVAQKLPVRKMKSLFSKFVQFEEQHGTPESVAKVCQMAKDYVETTGGAVDEDL